ncbi:hypothetical protein BpHYR1_052887 [Brachionus plicatilis]|uniref:HAT C-terminal dimerisation domain-containing protein n=1 Tax=Brachionus plicatilis TaxID=10195 RepID=A0A3M7T362_BRAPC|nr:hypothetical protein BpHYR1_052887 [Brachionus plicatilis]
MYNINHLATHDIFEEKSQEELKISAAVFSDSGEEYSSDTNKLFCLIGTSVPAESLFSAAGFFQNEERNRLSAKNLRPAKRRYDFIRTAVYQHQKNSLSPFNKLQLN